MLIQDDVTGDGTTSNVIMIGEMLKQAERRIDEGLHPRIVADGFDIAKVEALKVLDSLKSTGGVDRAVLLNVAQTSLRTKIHVGVADVLAPIVVDAVLSIKAAGGDIDLHMVRSSPHQPLFKLTGGAIMSHGACSGTSTRTRPSTKPYICAALLAHTRSLCAQIPTMSAGGDHAHDAPK